MTIIKANAPFPNNVYAFTTTIAEGNLATHTALDPQQALSNRDKLTESLNLPKQQTWLNQTHSTKVISLPCRDSTPNADAVFTQARQIPCIVMTADCLPMLISHRDGNEIAAIHAGWRGLRDGIIQKTIGAMQAPASELLCYLGPAISVAHLRLSQEIRDSFIDVNTQYQHGFIENDYGHFADLYQLARLTLAELGCHNCYGGDYCTYRDCNYFFSYRRQHDHAGRMASVIIRT